MSSEGKHVFCNQCGHKWEMSEYGELNAVEGETYFSHIPSWYEWQRECVRKEIEEGRYLLNVPCKIKSLPNTKGEDFSVTKISLATEELFKHFWEHKGDNTVMV